MSALPELPKRMTEAEYLAFERESEFKHEFIDGEVYMMTGASPNHNLITSSTIAALIVNLRGKRCKTFASDMKVRMPSTGSYAYPDVTIVCDDVALSDDDNTVLTNPAVIIEVLSSSMEGYDRGKKFQHYREIHSLKEYVLIAQDRPYVDRFLRQADGTWGLSDFDGLDAVVELTSIGCTLPLAGVYEQVDFDVVATGEKVQDD